MQRFGCELERRAIPLLGEPQLALGGDARAPFAGFAQRALDRRT